MSEATGYWKLVQGPCDCGCGRIDNWWTWFSS